MLLTLVFVTASLYLVVAASIERYLQLQHPRLSNKVNTDNLLTPHQLEGNLQSQFPCIFYPIM